MTRYIDAEKFEKEMYHEAFETDSDMQKWYSGCWIRYKMFENCIAQQPTADVVEVVHGEWLVVAFNKIMCSECKHIWNIMNNDVETFEHCPKCGVVMDRKEGETNE